MRKTLTLAASAAIMLFSAMKTSAQNPGGALIVNEISNGANGDKEFVELVAGSSDSTVSPNPLVDISRWIIDDNNGIFSNGSGSGKGISQGHLRLTQDSVFQNFPAGALLVLFNGENFDSTNTNFNQAVANAQTTGYHYASGAFYVAAGLSFLVESTWYTPTTTNAAYCSTSPYFPDTTWSMIGLRNDCAGDGIQTRCPGCEDFGEPTFYHGISYGTGMNAVAPQGFFGAAKVTLVAEQEDSTCAAGKRFYLNTATTLAAIDDNASWNYGVYSAATPGAANSTQNATLISNIGNRANGYIFGRCQLTEIPTDPEDTTSKRGKGVLLVTEVSNGPAGGCEYAEMIVANCGTDESNLVDVRGWILDDNAGNFSVNGCVTGTGIGKGHYRLSFNETWRQAKVGDVIVVYIANGTTSGTNNNCYNLPTAYQYNATTGVHYLPISSNGTVMPGTANIEMYASTPDIGSCQYCPTGTPGTYTTAANWTGVMSFGNSADAFQVRCPGCNSMYAGAPKFYHGFGYGPLTGSQPFAPIPASAGNAGGALRSGSGSGSVFEFAGTLPTNLDDSAFWTKSAAPAASMTPPATIGAVNAGFKANVLAHNLNLPCCGSPNVIGRFANTNTSGLNNTAVEAQGIFAYPNPANSVLNIEFPASENNVTVKVIDLNGRLAAQQTVAAGKTLVQFDVNNMAPGFYVYQVIANGTARSGKILINK